MTGIIGGDGFRSGFAALFGKPNAGKSTLMNALVGEKLAAVSGLPQTTRDRIHGILTTDTIQAVFVDLPGLVAADDKLNAALRARVTETLSDVDVVVHLVDATDRGAFNADVSAVLERLSVPVIFALNKTDKLPGPVAPEEWLAGVEHAPDPERYAARVALCALAGHGLDALQAAIADRLPPGPPLYDPDDLTDRSLRFLAGEIIREKVLHHTHQEVPYSTAVQVDAFEERPGQKAYIAATIHLERESQKGIVIGRGGERLKKISQAARADIEPLVGTGVFLELFVRVTGNWRQDNARLREFGYDPPKKKRRRRR